MLSMSRTVGRNQQHKQQLSVGICFSNFAMMLSRSAVVTHRLLFTARSKSSTAAAATKRCPITGAGVDTDNSQVELTNVPKLPILGSIIPQHSGVDKLDLSKTYDWWFSNHRKFGNFYSIGLPSLGKGLYGTAYVIADPNEYMKVLRKEGQHPFGAIMTE